jgi:hypothetical protein
MSNFVQIDSTLSNALLGVKTPASRNLCPDERRSAGHRNDIAMELFIALSSRFPVVKRLVGKDFFRELSRQYTATDPLCFPILPSYGDTFPAFIDGFEHAKGIPYLAAIARIDLARGLASHAAKVEVLSARDFATLDAGGIADLHITLHPSVSVVSSDFPIYSIWKVNQNRAPVIPVSPWSREDVLVVRPQNIVQVRKLADGQAAFLRALANDYSLSEAVSSTLESVPDFDATTAMTMLIDSKLVVGFKKADRLFRH